MVGGGAGDQTRQKDRHEKTVLLSTYWRRSDRMSNNPTPCSYLLGGLHEGREYEQARARCQIEIV